MGEIRSPYFSIDQDYLKDNAEIRSPYFSSGGDYLGYNAEIHSPYVSSGGDYLGDGAEIRSPYFSCGTRDYHGDNAEIHSSYSSVADYLGEDAEIPSDSSFQQNNIVENPYNRESFVEQDVVVNVYNTEKLIQHSDVQQLFMELAANTQSFVKKTNDEKCIFKVRHKLRESNDDFYTPQAVSIGPFHHDKNLQIEKTHKKEYLRAFCNRAVGETIEELHKFLEERLWRTIVENEVKINGYYKDAASVVPGFEFSKMVLYDAVFILEYLLRNQDFEEYEEKDPILHIRGAIRGDLMMLENQLPFFILEELYNHLREVSKRKYFSFRDLAYEYLNRYNKSAYNPTDSEDILHFIDLIRSSLSFSHTNSKTAETNEMYYSATQLHEARIKIKNRSPDECLLDVYFSPTKGELLIPSLKINSFTELLFLNLMAFELDHYEKKKYICHYIKLFKNLVGNSEDANLLIKNQIILGDKDGAAVKDLIEKLAAGIPEDDDTIYHKVYMQLETYYEKNITKNRGYLRMKLFSNFWIGTATVASTVLLLLAIVQTTCAVLSLP